MGFSCTIKQGDVNLVLNDTIHHRLSDLGPDSPNDTEAPYSVSDLRGVTASCEYGDRLKDAAADYFKRLQEMIRANLNSLKPCECPTCTCPEIVPQGWSKEACEKFLGIDPESITYLHGGW